MLLSTNSRKGTSRDVGTRRTLWTPASLGANLKGWWKADAGLFAQTSALFASASSESLSHTGTAALRGQSGTGGWWRAGWFRLTTLAATLYINNVGAPGNDGYHTEIDAAGVFQLRVGTGTGNTSKSRTGTALTTATWYFMYIQYDGTNIGLSIDNETLQTAAHATYSPGSGAFRLGANNTPASFLNGQMQEFCGGDGTLSVAQRNALYNSGAGITYTQTTLTTELLFWFPLHENSGTRTDSKGGLTLTDNNTVTDGHGKVEYAVTTDGEKVSRWADQSGTGSNLLQVTHLNKPIYKVNIINGRAILRFTGGSGNAEVVATATAPSIPTSPPWTVFSVASVDSTAAALFLLGKAETSGGWRVGNSTTSFRVTTLGVKDYDWATQWVAGTPASFIVDMDSAFDCILYKSGTSQGQVTHTAGPGANTLPFRVGGVTTGSWDGDVAEVLVHAAVLSAGERASLVAYSTGRYGI